MATEANSVTPAAQRRRKARDGSSVSFQRAKGPTPIRNTVGAIKGIKTASKYGGPTEIFPSPNASSSKGYKVPSSTANAATSNNTLLPNKADSLDHKEKRLPSPTVGARHAYRAKDEPTTTVKNAKINRPRRGSVAKAWTDESTPERTRKVPSSENENARIASSTVHDLKLLRFSVTASEWMSAVPSNHGMSEAFSTGSQNHQPPQPSS